MEEKASLACSHQELSTSREGLANLVTRAQTVTDEFERKVMGLKRAKAETTGLLSLEGEGRTLLIPSDKLTRSVHSTLSSTHTELRVQYVYILSTFSGFIGKQHNYSLVIGLVN